MSTFSWIISYILVCSKCCMLYGFVCAPQRIESIRNHSFKIPLKSSPLLNNKVPVQFLRSPPLTLFTCMHQWPCHLNLPVWERCGHDVSTTMSQTTSHPQYKPVSLFSTKERENLYPSHCESRSRAEARSSMSAFINEPGRTLTGVTGLTNTYQPST